MSERPQETLLRMFDEAAPWPTIRTAIRAVLMPETAALSSPETTPAPDAGLRAEIEALRPTPAEWATQKDWAAAKDWTLGAVLSVVDRYVATPASHGPGDRGSGCSECFCTQTEAIGGRPLHTAARSAGAVPSTVRVVPDVGDPIDRERLRKAIDLSGIGVAGGGHLASGWTDAIAAEYDRLAALPSREPE